MEKWHSDSVAMLFRAISQLQNEEECAAFFEDVCTVREIQEMARRLSVAKMLANGDVYTGIAKETGASTATISRVNRCLNYGNGGYRIVLARMEETNAD